MRERSDNTRMISKQDEEYHSKQIYVEQKAKTTDKTRKKLYMKNGTEPKTGGRGSRGADKTHVAYQEYV